MNVEVEVEAVEVDGDSEVVDEYVEDAEKNDEAADEAENVSFHSIPLVELIEYDDDCDDDCGSSHCHAYYADCAAMVERSDSGVRKCSKAVAVTVLVQMAYLEVMV